jgi:hypothetical protein
MDLADKFVQFAESGNQQRLKTRDNRLLQGWIMEVTEDSLLISTGAGEKGSDVWLKLADINLSSLAYWDSKTQQWLAFSA